MNEVLTTRMEREIIEHALGIQVKGGKKTKGGYRNFFAAYPESRDYDTCIRLRNKGLMVQGASRLGPTYFHVTDAGKKEVQP